MPQHIPRSLRTWFKIHFIVDLLVAIPLLFFPEWTLIFLSLPGENILAARLVGAALIGIGGNSLLMNKAGYDAYMVMLKLKIVWSSAALVALILEITRNPAPTVLIIFMIFLLFSLLWNSYHYRLTHEG